MKKLRATKLAGEAELVRLSHAEAIIELQSLPATTMVVLKRVTLPDSVGVQVKHPLKAPVTYMIGPPFGAATAGGTVVDVRDFVAPSPGVVGEVNNLTQTLSLLAVGFGSAIVVDIWVMAVP